MYVIIFTICSNNIMEKGEITIILADDHPIMLKGLKKELIDAGYTIVDCADNGAMALDLITKHKPMLALLDIEMPLLTGFEVIKRSREKSPNTKYIVMTYHREKGFVLQARNLGIHGYLLKEDGLNEIELCIQSVINGEDYISSSFSDGFDKIVEKELKKITLLTPSERTIIRLVAQGKSSAVIGETLLISTRTVQKHRTNIISKLGIEASLDSLSHWINEHRELVSSL